jgi:hypothetical protein
MIKVVFNVPNIGKLCRISLQYASVDNSWKYGVRSSNGCNNEKKYFTTPNIVDGFERIFGGNDDCCSRRYFDCEIIFIES